MKNSIRILIACFFMLPATLVLNGCKKEPPPPELDVEVTTEITCNKITDKTACGANPKCRYLTYVDASKGSLCVPTTLPPAHKVCRDLPTKFCTLRDYLAPGKGCMEVAGACKDYVASTKKSVAELTTWWDTNLPANLNVADASAKVADFRSFYVQLDDADKAKMAKTEVRGATLLHRLADIPQVDAILELESDLLTAAGPAEATAVMRKADSAGEFPLMYLTAARGAKPDTVLGAAIKLFEDRGAEVSKLGAGDAFRYLRRTDNNTAAKITAITINLIRLRPVSSKTLTNSFDRRQQSCQSRHFKACIMPATR